MENKTYIIDSEYMLRLVLDSIPIRVFWKDINSVFQGANQLFVEEAGLSDISELIGKTDYDMCWGKEQSDNFRKDDAQVIKSGKAKLSIEEPQTHIDGSASWLLTNKYA